MLFVEEILKLNKKQTPENLCLGLYSLASMDFYHQEYFDQVFISLQEQDVAPHIDQIATIAQSVAILRRSEYTNQLVDWFTEALNDGKDLNLFSGGRLNQGNESWQVSNELSFVSALQAILFLIGDNDE